MQFLYPKCGTNSKFKFVIAGVLYCWLFMLIKPKEIIRFA